MRKRTADLLLAAVKRVRSPWVEHDVGTRFDYQRAALRLGLIADKSDTSHRARSTEADPVRNIFKALYPDGFREEASAMRIWVDEMGAVWGDLVPCYALTSGYREPTFPYAGG